MKKKPFFALLLLLPAYGFTQMRWMNVDALFGPLPASVQVFRSVDSLDGSPFIGYYVKAKLQDRKLAFTVDTTLGRRLTPASYFERNKQPVVVVNCTFFNFDKNQNLNLVIRDGNILGYNNHSIPMRGKDTFQYRHPLASALGITKKRKADVAWTLTDSSRSFAYASQLAPDKPIRDSVMRPSFADLQTGYRLHYEKWKMKTAIGGGPVLVQDGGVKITNNEELKFAGKAIGDKHPRTCIGYTNDGYLIIMAIQGRFPGIAEGATLEQEARLLVGLGCVEALNLDGGGSSCLLINGKETIQPSDKGGQRPVPAVFMISVN
ncbi:MAG TPA: phosphodiester glycosidase family protein [Ferruginibacter sp.]|nr:phosphodiester glycosidase family protein [Ferruginibacter sp.]